MSSKSNVRGFHDPDGLAGSVIAHIFNAWWLAVDRSPHTAPRVITFFEVNLTTGPGVTGWIMTACLATMVWYANERRRRANFERFWATHHLFVVLFVCWQLHGMFCLIKPDRPPFCSWTQIGLFWRYWLPGGVIYIVERILREVRARQRTYISKLLLHQSRVIEVQIKKDRVTTRAGQYILL